MWIAGMMTVKYLRYCRMCANKKDLSLLLPMVNNGQELYDITKKIAALHIEFSSHDKLPQEICHMCLPRMEMAYMFMKACERAQQKLIQIAHNGVNLQDTIQVKRDKINVCHDNQPNNIKDIYNNDASTITKSFNFEENFTSPRNICDKRPNTLSSDVTHDVEINNEDKHDERDEDENSNHISSVEKDPQGNLKRNKTNTAKATLSEKPRNVLSCSDCSKQFRTRSGLTFHIQTLHVNNILVCEICGKSFLHKTNLNVHRATHLPDEMKKLHACNACDKRFRSKFLLKEHLNVHYNLRPHTCSVCKKSFHQSYNLKAHMARHVEVCTYSCHHCGKQMSRKVSLISHIRRHAEPGNTSCCRICGERFQSAGQLKRHGLAVHTQEDLRLRWIKLDKNVAECPICHKFLSRLTLRTHVKVHTAECPVHCEVCGQSLRSQSSLTYHLKAFHSAEDSDKKWRCQYCDAAFMTRDQCTRHEYRHTGEAPFKCSECDKCFRSQSSLRQHRLVHQGASEQHECHVCHKQFKRRGTLNVHLRIHTGNLPFECTFCEKKFAQKNDMLKHVSAIHWNKMRCKHCSKTFSSQEQCKDHSNSCSKFSKTIIQDALDSPKHTDSSIIIENNHENLSTFVLHNNIHNSNSSDQDLVVHNLTDLRYICTICNVTFTSEERLDRHFRGFHGQSNVGDTTVETYHLEYALQ